MASLYDGGWRQGALLRHQLPLDSVVVDDQDQPVRESNQHDLWVVATQNCDLDVADDQATEPLIELRPVLVDNPPLQLGLRSRKVRLSRDQPWYLDSDSQRTMVRPAALTAILSADAEARSTPLTADESTKFKTWLGRRYDRPAVPHEAMDLGRAIAAAVENRRNDPLLSRVRDVLWQYELGNPIRFSLFAIIESEDDHEAAREFLVDVTTDVDPELGVADEIEAATSERTSLDLIETSYSADVSDITWRRGHPQGAN